MITKYSLKHKNIKIWTVEGFKKIDKIYHIKKKIKLYKISTDMKDYVLVPENFRIKTPRGYILPKDLKPSFDAIFCHTEKNLNTLRTLKNCVAYKSIDEYIIIKTEDIIETRTFLKKELDEKYVCLDKNGNRITKKLKEITENDFIQVGDEFKKIICKKEINEEEGLIVLNINNNNIFLNNICVINPI